MSSDNFNFEKAFHRLEEILEKLNSGDTPLDESLKLYEEADGLIGSCGKKLNDAEKRIEVLIKTRNGDLSLSVDQRPEKNEFRPGK